MQKFFLSFCLLVILIIVGGYFYVSATWRVSYDADFSASEIVIKPDAELLKRGKYLVYGPAHCSDCHTPMSQRSLLEAGEELPLIGGFEWELPIGNVYAPNITPCSETGIGKMSDGQLYRMLRHNIKLDGTTTIEFMPFANLSDYDIKAIIAFIKSQPPVKHEVPSNDFNFMGKAVMKFLIKPTLPNGTPPAFVAKDTTVEYGQYLAASVANCRGCHTARDLKTGAFIGPEYAGGMHFEPSKETQGWDFITPNLTPAPNTGRMTHWTEEQFVARFKAGRVYPASPMPWASFKMLDDDDLKALYKFFQSLKPVENQTAGKMTPPENI